MTKKLRLWRALLLVFLATLPFAASEAQSPSPTPLEKPKAVSLIEVGRVIQLEGQSVTRKPIDAEHAQEVALGEAIWQYDTLVTAASSKVKIEFLDDSVLVLKENTELMLTRYVFDPKTSRLTGLLDLVRGEVLTRLSAILKKQPENSFEIEAPNAVIGVRGSEFVARVIDGETQAYALESSLYVENRSGEVRELKPGNTLGLTNDGVFQPERVFAASNLRPAFKVRGAHWEKPKHFKRQPPRIWKPTEGKSLPQPWVREWRPHHFSPRPRWLPAEELRRRAPERKKAPVERRRERRRQKRK